MMTRESFVSGIAGHIVNDEQIAAHYLRMREGLRNMVPDAIDVTEMPAYLDRLPEGLTTVLVLRYTVRGKS